MAGPSKSDIFAMYVSMRQSGQNPDEVIQSLTEAAYQLSREDRHALGRAVQDWETSNNAMLAGNEPSTRKTDTTTGPASAAPAKPAIKRLPQAAGPSSLPPALTSSPSTPGPGPSPFGTKMLSPEALAAIGAPTLKQPRLCPHCGKKNQPKDTYCYSCGHILLSKRDTTKQLDAKARWGTAYFPSETRLYLTLRGATQPIELLLSREFVIGRSTAESSLKPDVDLSPYNAEELGVSRMHAAVRQQDDTVVLTDLQSSNRTYINGQALYPHEVRVLRNGDEIRLGKLVMKVSFKAPR